MLHALTAALQGLDHPFWATRFNLQAGVLDRPQALVGAERIRDILTNIHYPLAVAGDDAAWVDFLSEKGPTPAGIMRTTARRLLELLRILRLCFRPPPSSRDCCSSKSGDYRQPLRSLRNFSEPLRPACPCRLDGFRRSRS